jgi:hypothetical protein
MDSDHLFVIFKLALHIKREEFLAQAEVTLAKFDSPDLDIVVFLIPMILIL